MKAVAQRLAAGVAALGVSLSDAQQQQLVDYVALLHKWNRAFNLTAVRDPQEMVTRHILDALAVLPWLGSGSTLDVGTGGGIPGIVLAIARPQQPFVLLDSNGKKTRFVRQAALELGLANVEVVQARVEQYRNGASQVISRAFASLVDMVSVTGHLLEDGGHLLAMKGALVEQEIAALPPQWQAEAVELSVPGLAEARYLVVLQPAPQRIFQGDCA